MQLYDEVEKNCKLACFSILNDCTINCEGKFVLCCLDWKNMHCLANLNERSLKEALSRDKVQHVFDALKCGNRILHLCRRCTWQR